ncbi:putative protein AF-9 [Trypanosoma grayi]|uniref:putative protein AF-9 n=1 Tax=Trypanosoma grayi TaxID=71804 RepID=UPI0004F3F535|nr:putative protein AF-9 [Trypanosoma grayi]KEG09804.1 putative protein AF-9 [Trypanosoma grayi]
MLHDGLASPTRIFTIQFEGEVFQASINCRVVRTLRELLTVAVPSPPTLSPSATAAASSAKHQAHWVDGCICSFGGQRLSLGTSTDVVPAVLQVNWLVRYHRSNSMSSGGGKTSTGRVNASKRARSRGAVKTEEDDSDNGNDDNYNDDYNDDVDGRSGDEGSQQQRSYWRRDTSNIKDEDEDDDHDDAASCDSRGSNSNSTGSSGSSALGLQRREVAEKANGDNSDDDGRRIEAVLPVVVGGVVRLVNMESRDKSHEWTVYIRGLFNENQYLAQCIESVRFILDPSFTPSERLVTTAPFELTEVGWGEFVVKMKVQLRHYPRPIQVELSSSSFATAGSGAMSTAVAEKMDMKMASALWVSQTGLQMAGLTRGPVLSPVVDLLSRHRYYSNNKTNSNGSNSNNLAAPASSISSRRAPVKKEMKKEEDVEDDDKSNRNHYINNIIASQTPPQSSIATLEMCPGVVILSHLLRFSHRPRRGHCIPPLGRPYEPEEHIGYTLVQVPVVTEQYDEIVVPDPPPEIRQVAQALPDMLRPRITTVKAARALAAQPQHAMSGSTPPLRAAAAFSENGVSCWKYVMAEEPDDAVLAESYLESISVPLFPHLSRHGAAAAPSVDQQQQQQQQLYGVDPSLVVKPGRGRRKLTGAEIDLAALKTAKKGLVEAIERMRREVSQRQSAHIFQQYT